MLLRVDLDAGPAIADAGFNRVLAGEFGLNLTDAELAAIMVVLERRRQDAQPGDLFA